MSSGFGAAKGVGLGDPPVVFFVTKAPQTKRSE